MQTAGIKYVSGTAAYPTLSLTFCVASAHYQRLLPALSVVSRDVRCVRVQPLPIFPREAWSRTPVFGYPLWNKATSEGARQYFELFTGKGWRGTARQAGCASICRSGGRGFWVYGVNARAR
jgi:hypothetical protein